MADLFNEKSKEWDKNDLVQGISSSVSSAIIEHLPLSNAMEVMDFGAGTGLISSRVAPFVGKIVAVDISESMLNELVAKEELKGKVQALCQNIMEEPADQKFDLIMSAMAIHHVEDTKKLIKTFYEHLKPGAKVALADLEKEDGTFHSAGTKGVFHQGFEKDAFAKLLEEEGFAEIELHHAHCVEKEGKVFPIFLAVATKI